MGPPLISSFEATLPETLVDQAVTIYRQYYHEKRSIQINSVSSDSRSFESITRRKHSSYVTTSKHEPVALQMCQDLGIDKYFKGIYGSNSDRIHKADVIRYALSINDLPKEETVIIGDTKFDLIGGQAVGIKTMAVTWGFGEQADLLNYQPDYIAHKPLKVLEYFQ